MLIHRHGLLRLTCYSGSRRVCETAHVGMAHHIHDERVAALLASGTPQLRRGCAVAARARIKFAYDGRRERHLRMAMACPANRTRPDCSYPNDVRARRASARCPSSAAGPSFRSACGASPDCGERDSCRDCRRARVFWPFENPRRFATSADWVVFLSVASVQWSIHSMAVGSVAPEFRTTLEGSMRKKRSNPSQRSTRSPHWMRCSGKSV